MTVRRRRLTIFACLSISLSGLGCTQDEEISPAPLYPQEDVELVKDDLGITHIFAKTDADAFFGEGYSMARDRLFEMELNRRQAYGTRAEVLGPSAVNDDIAARTMAFGKLGAADAEALRKNRPADYALVEAWAAGVNAVCSMGCWFMMVCLFLNRQRSKCIWVSNLAFSEGFIRHQALNAARR